MVDRLTQFMDRRMRATGSREFREQDLKAMAGNVETKDWDKASSKSSPFGSSVV